MCIIAIKPAGTPRPNNEMFKNMCRRNPDGFGMVTWDPKKGLEVKKTMSEEEYMKWVSEVSEETPAIFHMRIATHGSVKKKNCHPFIADDRSWAFAHNGILSIQNEKDMTDSETFFRRIAMPMIKAGHTPGNMTFDAMVATIIGSSKFAFINDKGKLFSYGNYIEKDGLLFSNSSYETPTFTPNISKFWQDVNPFSGDYNHGKKNEKQYTLAESTEDEFDYDDYQNLVDDLVYNLYYDSAFYEGMSEDELWDMFKNYYVGIDKNTFHNAYEEAIGIVNMEYEDEVNYDK